MRSPFPSNRAILSLVTFGLLGLSSQAEIRINAEVLASTAESSTVRFTFTGDLSDLEPDVNLRSFLFIDFAESPALKAAFPRVLDEFSFVSNTVLTEANRTITKVEIRNDEAVYFDRVSFAFDGGLTSATTFPNTSTLDVVLPTSAVITTSDFSNLPIYWCFPNWGTNQGRGTLAGITNPISETPASITLTKDLTGQISIEFTGVLESSPDLSTPFTPVPGASSPFLISPGAPSRQFFRVSPN